MKDIGNPGPLALSLGANAVATCVCGFNIFFPLVRMNPNTNEDLLVALKCSVCGEETVVPLDVQHDTVIRPGGMH